MSQTTKPTLLNSLLDIALVVIEALLSLILRFDAPLRRLAYPLACQEKIVHIRTYLPHSDIYATFSYKGILLDSHLPYGKTPDLTINAYCHELAMIALGNNDKAQTLQIRGKDEDVLALRAFLTQFSLNSILDNTLGKLKKKPLSDAEKQAKAQKRDDKIIKLTAQLDEQTLLAERLTAENRKLGTELRQVKGTQKSTFIALMVMTVIAFVSIVAHFFR